MSTVPAKLETATVTVRWLCKYRPGCGHEAVFESEPRGRTAQDRALEFVVNSRRDTAYELVYAE